MIAYLQGTLHELGEDSVIILSHGVGYQVFVSKSTLLSLGHTGADLALKIQTVVREDSLQLFGFQSNAEKKLFNYLTQVSGIGPKLAMTIMSGLPAPELVHAISREDLVRLTAISGIGKKTAQRLIVELRDKLFALDIASPLQRELTGGNSKSASAYTPSEEVLSALTNLGYTRPEALRAIESIPNSDQMPLEALLREGLKALS